MRTDARIDFNETEFFEQHRELLRILLADRTTEKNIIWASEDYSFLGKGRSFGDQILLEHITGCNSETIKPRVKKILQLQVDRSRDMAEVFTPSWIVNIQNNNLDDGWFGKRARRFNTTTEEGWETNYYPIRFPEETGKTWKNYALSTQLEVSCGEAPYLTSRYDAVSGTFIPPRRRIGLLDRKLRVVGENCTSVEEWKRWAIEAVKSVYGFEWQGDNILLARENLFLTVLEHFSDKFQEDLDVAFMEEIALIISWNIWQMDGMKYVIPNTCHEKKGPVSFDLITNEEVFKIYPCEGCAKNQPKKHNGIYCYIMDWNENKKVRFVDIIGGKKHAKL